MESNINSFNSYKSFNGNNSNNEINNKFSNSFKKHNKKEIFKKSFNNSDKKVNHNTNLNKKNIVKEKNFQQKLDEALQFDNEYNFNESFNLYNNILESINKNINNIKNNKTFLINFYNQISNSFYLQRKFNDALKYNEIVFQIDNKNKKAFLLLINILYDLNEIDKCLLIQDKIINLFKKPKDIEMFKNIFYKINMKQLENNKMEIMENNYKMEKKIIDFFNNDIIKWSLAISGIILSGFLIKKILKK
jgi:hypothetical protein